MADLAPSLPSRTVTIDVLELDEATPAQGYISFVLPCDLYVAADDKIIQAMSKTVQLVDGKAAGSLPCFSSAAVSQDGRTDWALMVRKSWHPDHPYYIRVPSGTAPISLADLGPARRALRAADGFRIAPVRRPARAAGFHAGTRAVLSFGRGS